ncbi:MAG: family 78 glycoside hydrolase catalytic domain [Clostridia bacterium]
MPFKKARWIVHGMFADSHPLDIRKKGILNQENPEHPDEYRNRHTLFRLAFDSMGKRTILRYSADDIARIYIDGKQIDMGPAPAYHFAFGYIEIDITGYLVPGRNVLCGHLYYQGELNRVSPGGDFRTGFIAEIEAGEEILAFTDENVPCRLTNAYGRGEVIAYRTQYLENFDARIWEYEWKLPEFDDSHWEKSSVKANNDHVFRKQISRRLQFYDVRPVSEAGFDGNVILYDLGCEYSGTVYFEAAGKSGDIIEVRCAEELDENGRARYNMRCNCLYRQTFILSGEKGEYPVFYDYMAFRYIELVVPDGVVIENVMIKARNYPFDYESTAFESANERMNGIWTICKNGVRTGTQEGYLDCPTREKGLYLGDMTITGQSHFYLTGDLPVMKRALRGFADSSYYIKSIQTTTLNHYINSLVDYSFQFPLNLLIYYKHSGDKDFLAEMLPYCKGMMDYYRGYEKDGLLFDITKELHLVDWPRNPYDFTDGYDYNLEIGKTYGTHNIANIFHILGVLSMNRIYEILGIGYEDRLPELRQAYIDAFYDRGRKLFRDTPDSSHTALHSNIMPLYCGIAPRESIPEIIGMIEKKRLNCGVYMAYFLLKGLIQNEAAGLAFDLILSDDVFSWGTMLRQDATTCFEVWHKDYKWNTSLCHPWASSPIPILVEDIAGISPVEPGWKEGYAVNPCGTERLGDFNLVIHANGYRIKILSEDGSISHRAIE